MSQSSEKTDKSTQTELMIPGTLLGKSPFCIEKEIGGGGYGVIYSATDNSNNGQPVAIKVSKRSNHDHLRLTRISISRLERSSSSSSSPDLTKDRQPMRTVELHWDLKVEYSVLTAMKNVKGFPKVYELGTTVVSSKQQVQTYLVMELLGQSLASLFTEQKYSFSVKTLLIITDQLLERLEKLHSKGIIHGDLTPSNIILGTGENSGTLYLIDFGLSTKYVNPSTGKHLPLQLSPRVGGVPQFASRHVQRGIQASRRDDLESLAYVLAYFANHGELPWNRLEKTKTIKKPEIFAAIKESTMPEELFYRYPKEFAKFLDKVRLLKYADEPPYEKFRNLFKKLGDSLGVRYDLNKLL